MKPSLRVIVGLLCLGLLLLNACSSDKGPGQQRMAPEVGVVELKPTRIELTSELVGRTVSFLQAEVRPQVRGLVRGREFVEGGDVKAGQTLYLIEPESYQAMHDNAKAALAKAEANQEVTRLRARRVAELRKTNAVSQQDHDDAQAAYLQAQAEVAACRAALDTTAIDLSRTKITAPISGRISKSSVTVGALITADQAAPLATIHQVDPMYVDMTQSADGLMQLRQTLVAQNMTRSSGDHVKVTLLFSDGTVYPHPGSLRFADVGVNEATGTVTLRAEFPNPDELLLPGLYVRGVLREGENDQALLVPQRSILRDNRGEPLVLVVTPEGTADRRPIKLGKSHGDSWVVLSGLQPGEQVIVEGIQKVRPGSPVRAVPYAPPAAKTHAPGPNGATGSNRATGGPSTADAKSGS